MDAVFFFIFQMFPPTMCGTVVKRRRKVYICINLQCNNDFLGNEPVENDVIVIPDKARKTGPHRLSKFLHVCRSSYLYRLHVGSVYKIHRNVWDKFER